jgi:hypothetical protein
MIVFDLRCVKDHRFEGWFASNEEFARQLAAGQVACPYCDDTRIEKALSPVAVKKSSGSPLSREAALQAWAQICRYVQDSFEDVGHSFAKEALKIHCGLSEERQIRGVTTAAEEETLREEGVPFAKIPMPPQLDN